MEKIVLEELSDNELLEIIDELQKENFADDSIVRKIAFQFFGGGTTIIQLISVANLLLPIVAERMKNYRAYIPYIDR